MTDQKQEKPKQPNWLIKAGGDAILAGGAFGLGALVAGVPSEYIARVSLAGAGYSLYISWKHSKEKDGPRQVKNRGRSIPFTTIRGTKNVYPDDTLEYSTEQSGYILRESYGQAAIRFILRKGSRPVVRSVEPVSKPRELDEFMFYSMGMQLRQTHVKLFLNRAWKWRKFGKGLSARQHVRNFSQMPAWYQELSPVWFYAMLDLLGKAGNYTGLHLVIEYENGWRSLVVEPHLTMRILRWYEIERRK